MKKQFIKQCVSNSVVVWGGGGGLFQPLWESLYAKTEKGYTPPKKKKKKKNFHSILALTEQSPQFFFVKLDILTGSGDVVVSVMSVLTYA